jgi:probable phosphoglycerate mutase
MTLAACVLSFLAASPAALGPVPAGVVRVYLVRHGQAVSNLEPKPNLPPDQLDRLTDLGREQARRAGGALRGGGVVLVLSSPAGRARETAEEIRAALGAPPVRLEPRLRPLDLGRAPGGKALTWDDRGVEWKAGRDPVPEGGESMEQMGQRVLDLVRAEARERPGKSVVLVAHGEVIGAFVGLVEKTPPAKRYPPTARNGSLTVVEMGVATPPALLLSDFVPVETEVPQR